MTNNARFRVWIDNEIPKEKKGDILSRIMRECGISRFILILYLYELLEIPYWNLCKIEAIAGEKLFDY